MAMGFTIQNGYDILSSSRLDLIPPPPTSRPTSPFTPPHRPRQVARLRQSSGNPPFLRHPVLVVDASPPCPSRPV